MQLFIWDILTIDTVSYGISIAANSSKLNVLGTMLALRPPGHNSQQRQNSHKKPLTPLYWMVTPEGSPWPVPTPDSWPDFVYDYKQGQNYVSTA